MTNRWGKMETVTDFIFLGSKSTADGDYSHKIKKKNKKLLLLGRKAMTNLDSILKSRHITLLTKIRVVRAMVSPVVMDGCKLDRKEGWEPKNWCFQTVVLGKTLESPWDSKEIKLVSPKRNQPEYWLLDIGRTGDRAETPVLWPPWCKEPTHWKRPWCWERLMARGEGNDRGWDG